MSVPLHVQAQLLPVSLPDVSLKLSYGAAKVLRDMVQNAATTHEDAEIKAVREMIFLELSDVLKKRS